VALAFAEGDAVEVNAEAEFAADADGQRRFAGVDQVLALFVPDELLGN